MCSSSYRATVSGSLFSQSWNSLFLLCDKNLFLKAAFVASENRASCCAQNINVGVEKEIVGRSQAAPIWPPVTSRLSMLIMEPVNANNTRLRTDIRQERNPPPLLSRPLPLPQRPSL